MSEGDRKASTFVGRLILAHLVAYPIAIAWIVLAMPFAFPLLGDQAMHATGDASVLGLPMTEGQAIVFRAVLVVGAVIFLIEHAIGVIWALGKDAARARRNFTIASLILGCLGVIGAVGGWIWFLLKYTGEPR